MPRFGGKPVQAWKRRGVIPKDHLITECWFESSPLAHNAPVVSKEERLVYTEEVGISKFPRSTSKSS